jgi:hypothetical protein
VGKIRTIKFSNGDRIRVDTLSFNGEKCVSIETNINPYTDIDDDFSLVYIKDKDKLEELISALQIASRKLK